MPQVEITIVPKEIGEIFDDILDEILNDLTRKQENHGTRPLKELIPHHYYENYKVYQGQCYKQYSSNLCGYHATFNALCCLNMYLNLKSQYIINSGASFWKFKKKVQKFLLEIKHANRLGDKWPWRESDILWGDFQRTYNKICTELFDDFDIFKENHEEFNYMHFTWEFQYQNLLVSQQSRAELNKKITYFQNYKGQKPLIFGIMMGITCHWTVLLAFKKQNKTQYWYFDSHNDLLLDMNDQQINKYIADYEVQRKQMGKAKLTNFQKEKYFMSVKDSQISVKLIVDCLESKASIDEYVYNQLFNVFAKPLEQAIKTGVQLFSQTIKDYWYNISAFFKSSYFQRQTIQWKLLTQESKHRLILLYKAAQQCRKQSQQGKKLYDILRSQNLQKALF